MTNEIMTGKEKLMTTKEVAQALNVDVSTIQKHTKTMFPGLSKNGKTTYLNEFQVTKIKKEIEISGRKDLGNVSEVKTLKTMLEKQLIIKQAAILQNEIIEDYKNQIEQMSKVIEIQQPKVESFNTFMTGCNSIDMARTAQIFGLGRNTLFKMLREAKILKDNNSPYQQYAHYFEVIIVPIEYRSGFVENESMTKVKPNGIEYIEKRFNLTKKNNQIEMF